MAANSAIEWTDHTFNPWRGCTKVHAGCTNCYAEVNYSVKMHGVKWGPNGTRVKLSDAGWREPLKWNRDAQAAGERRRVFCASLADVFEDWQGPILSHDGERLYRTKNGKYATLADIPVVCEDPATLDDLRRDLFKLIDATPWLDWLLLTKRPENIRRMWAAKDDVRPIFPGAPGKLGEPLPCKVTGAHRSNVWLGTSISDQKTADEFVPRLLKNRDLAPVLFLSCEPLLGPINLVPHFKAGSNEFVNSQGINCDWVIVGGESGPHARECNIVWVRSIVEQCKAAGVPVFVKQLGSKPIEHVQEDMAKVLFPGGVPAGAVCAGQYEHLRTFRFADTKGGDIAEWPEDLRVREFPRMEVAHA
jgi:protein gp37